MLSRSIHFPANFTNLLKMLYFALRNTHTRCWSNCSAVKTTTRQFTKVCSSSPRDSTPSSSLHGRCTHIAHKYIAGKKTHVKIKKTQVTMCTPENSFLRNFVYVGVYTPVGVRGKYQMFSSFLYLSTCLFIHFEAGTLSKL